jgi:electron transfer flavoprotein alpha subunit
MGNVIAFCEYTGDSLRSSALVNIAFARQAADAHGGEVIAVLIGADAGAAGAHAASYAPRVITVSDDALEHYMAESYAPILVDVAEEHDASVVCATANSTGKDLLPRVAVLLGDGVGMASDIAAQVDANQFKRPILAGNAYTTVEIATDVMCVSVRQSEFEPAAELDSPGAVETAEADDIETYGAEIVRIESVKSDRPDLNDADVVVSGGRGMKSGENFKVLEELADLLGAAMGASRAATDAGMVPADWQVGQTGKIVAPNLYFAVAISGAIQHLAGMKSSKTIVAINKDPDAPIFQVADYGLVTTWEQALPELIAEIRKVKDAQD